MMIRVLQGNLHRSKTADDLLTQIVFEKKVDLLIISEQYKERRNATWFTDTLGTAAIWIPNPKKVPVEQHGTGSGFVWVRSRGITYISCYLTPSDRIADFHEKLDLLEDTIREQKERIIVAGDLNARALEWGSPWTDSRGKRILELAARVGLIVMNEGNTPTFRRLAQKGTIPDVTLASETLTTSIQHWKVIEDYTGSDHQYITYNLERSPRVITRSENQPRWNVIKLNEERFDGIILEGSEGLSDVYDRSSEPDRVEAIVDATSQLIYQACNASMPKKKNRSKRRSAYWWSEEIAGIRRQCLEYRRKVTRARRKTGNKEITKIDVLYKQAKKKLQKTIGKSKSEKWKDLSREVNNEPWGLGYRIVTRKLGVLSTSDTMDPATMDRILDHLFPTHPVREAAAKTNLDEEITLFTTEELLTAASRTGRPRDQMAYQRKH